MCDSPVFIIFLSKKYKFPKYVKNYANQKRNIQLAYIYISFLFFLSVIYIFF